MNPCRRASNLGMPLQRCNQTRRSLKGDMSIFGTQQLGQQHFKNPLERHVQAGTRPGLMKMVPLEEAALGEAHLLNSSGRNTKLAQEMATLLRAGRDRQRFCTRFTNVVRPPPRTRSSHTTSIWRCLGMWLCLCTSSLTSASVAVSACGHLAFLHLFCLFPFMIS